MKMTWKKLLARIAEGFGQGHHDEYKAFLQNTRRSSSDAANQSSGNWLPGYKRRFDYLARAERNIALGLLWLGARDIREGFPMWPMSHQHPLVGAVGAQTMRLHEVPGLWELAKAANIDHGVYVGTSIPYVATLDFMVTVQRNGVPGLVAIPCKPREQIFAADAASRMLERMELERLYCNTLSIPRRVADAKVFGKRLTANLEWLAQPDDLTSNLRCDTALRRFFDSIERWIYDTPINRVVSESAAQIDWPIERGQQAFRFLAWRQIIDINLSEPVVMTEPARSGGKALRAAMQKTIFGEIDNEQI